MEKQAAAETTTVDSSNGVERGEEDQKNSLATSFMSGAELRRVLERFPDILGEQSDERRDQMCIDDWDLGDPFEGAGDHLKEIEDPLLIPGGEELFSSDAFEYYNEELTDHRYCHFSIWWCGCDQPHVISVDDEETTSNIQVQMIEAFEKGGLIPVQEIDPLAMPPSTTEEHEEDQAIWEEGEDELAMDEGEEDQFEEESLVNRCVKVLGEHYNLVDWPSVVIPDHLMRLIRHARTSC